MLFIWILLAVSSPAFSNFETQKSVFLGNTVESLNLPSHVINLLKDSEVTFIEDLTKMTEEDLLRIHGISKRATRQIKAVLAERGLSLKSGNAVESWNLTFKVINQLQIRKITTIEDLTKMTEEDLSRIPGIGKKAINQIKAILAQKGLSLKKEKRLEIESGDLLTHVINLLDLNNITTPEDLTKMTEGDLSRILGISKRATRQIKAILAQKGLSLKPDVTIKSLGLSSYITKLLKANGIIFLEDLTKMTEQELLDLPDFIKQDLDPIKDAMAEKGVSCRAPDNLAQWLGFSLKDLQKEERSEDTIDSLIFLSSYIINLLKIVGLKFVEDLISLTERNLKETPELNEPHIINQIKAALAEIGLSLKKEEGSEIEGLGLSPNVINKLKNSKITSVEDLKKMRKEDLLHIPGFIESDLSQVEVALTERGLSLKSDVTIKSLKLSYYVINQLNKAKIKFIKDLTSLTEQDVLNILGLAKQDLDQIVAALAEIGLSLKPDDTIGSLGLPSYITNQLEVNGIKFIEDLTTLTEQEVLNITGLAKQDLNPIKAALAEIGLSLKLDDTIKSLGLPSYITNQLNKAKIKFIKDLTTLTKQDVLNIPGLAKQDLDPIEAALAERGLSLKPDDTIGSLGLPSYIMDQLEFNGIKFIEDLTTLTEQDVLNITGLAKQDLDQIKAALAEIGLSLKPDDTIGSLGLPSYITNQLEVNGIKFIEDLTTLIKTEFIEYPRLG